jgi:hypothetical protein
VLVPGLTLLSGLLSTMERPVDLWVWPPTVAPAATSIRVIAKRPHRNQIAVLKQPPTRSTRGSRSVALVFNRSLQSKSICIKWVSALAGMQICCSPPRSAPTVLVGLIKGWTALMPIGRLLESVAGAQNQRLFHVPANDLEPNR